MILYKVCGGTVTVLSVAKETKTGWRKHNNGFINRRELRKYPDPSVHYYTTDITEARKWCYEIISHMYDLIQVGHATISDLDFWEGNGMCEEDIPKSRWMLC